MIEYSDTIVVNIVASVQSASSDIGRDRPDPPSTGGTIKVYKGELASAIVHQGLESLTPR